MCIFFRFWHYVFTVHLSTLTVFNQPICLLFFNKFAQILVLLKDEFLIILWCIKEDTVHSAIQQAVQILIKGLLLLKEPFHLDLRCLSYLL